jgi:hypothetical protein
MDTENVWDGGRIVINGGDPIKDCPTDYDWAHQWAENANSGWHEYEGPFWKWDCGFKLDYDGPVVRFSSRFYPPKTHSGDRWDGDVTVCIFDREIMQKRFDCATLEELRTEVEAFTAAFAADLAKWLGGANA